MRCVCVYVCVLESFTDSFACFVLVVECTFCACFAPAPSQLVKNLCNSFCDVCLTQVEEPPKTKRWSEFRSHQHMHTDHSLPFMCYVYLTGGGAAQQTARVHRAQERRDPRDGVV